MVCSIKISAYKRDLAQQAQINALTDKVKMLESKLLSGETDCGEEGSSNLSPDLHDLVRDLVRRVTDNEKIIDELRSGNKLKELPTTIELAPAPSAPSVQII